MAKVRLPQPGGTLSIYETGPPASFSPPSQPLKSRSVYAAAHVVADPLADTRLGGSATLDWESTLAFRRHLWSYGLGDAEAMDTAQRGMGLDWDTTVELIERSCAEAKAEGGAIVCGVGTDQLPADEPASLEAIVGAYEEQLEVVQRAGGRAILMCSRHLAAAAEHVDDYRAVYGKLLGQVDSPVLLHWLGEAFDPALAGYWGAADVGRAAANVLDLIGDYPTKVAGIKLSLLDRDSEPAMRRRLPAGVRLYTGDDFHYPEMIAGDADGHSDALLGIFDAIAPAAAAAVEALDRADRDAYDRILAPTVPLSRHMFGRPTYYYKTGVVFMAYLNGQQDHFRMVGGLESARSPIHLAEQFVLADRAGLLADPELASHRMSRVLELAGVDPA